MTRKIRTTTPAPLADPADAVTVPRVLARSDELISASAGLLTLVGLDINDVLRDGFEFTGERLSGKSAKPIVGVEPEPSHDGEGAIWVWPFEVVIS